MTRSLPHRTAEWLASRPRLSGLLITASVYGAFVFERM